MRPPRNAGQRRHFGRLEQKCLDAFARLTWCWFCRPAYGDLHSPLTLSFRMPPDPAMPGTRACDVPSIC